MLYYLEKIFRKINKVICYLRGWVMFGKLIYVEKNVTIKGYKNIEIGNNCRIHNNSILDASNGRISIGENTNIAHDVTIVASNSNVKLGNNCYIGEYTQIAAYLNCDISIGNDTLIAPFNFIISSNHGIERSDLIRHQKGFGYPIKIEEDVWISAKCTILAGSVIKRGSVVGANSLVNRKTKTKEYGIFVGNPAKLKAERV